MKRSWRIKRDERGVTAVVVAVCMVSLIGATVIAVDSGSAWKTKRDLVTDTDAAALAAARMFAMGLADPCTQAGRDAAQLEAVRVMKQNNPDARHDPVSTPNGFEVTLSGPCPAPAGGVTPGRVRFDGRLLSKAALSGIFDSGGVDAISVSIAQFGYVTEIAAGLRPIAVCDQSRWTYTAPPLLPPPGGAPFPHFALWDQLQKGLITQAQYDLFFGIGPEYPASDGEGRPYLTPLQGGGVVHLVNSRDTCGGGSGWRGWVDLDGAANGTPDLVRWLLKGFEGTVSLGASPPRNCNNPSPGAHCEVLPGNHNASGVRAALNSIKCPRTTPSKDCNSFPVLLDNQVSGGGSTALVHQTGFLWVILRDWGGSADLPCEGGSDGCTFHFEFVKIQTQGALGQRPPGPDITTAVGTSLCGVDHDSVEHRCNV